MIMFRPPCFLNMLTTLFVLDEGQRAEETSLVFLADPIVLVNRRSKANVVSIDLSSYPGTSIDKTLLCRHFIKIIVLARNTAMKV